ncbi:MAG: hypothetical protein M1832_005686 [Thelocarpon impressellum]|nr:MAG: hypothetical protein M1832_005686 [Thelocarpon impressellum]
MEDIIMTEADIDCVDYDNVCQEQPATILTMPNEILAKMIYLQTNNRTGYYYLPEIEELTIRLTGISYATCRLNQKRLAFYNAGVRLENSGLEQRRRGLRRQIVEAAQALWEGIDPYPVKVTNTETGEVTLQSRPFLPTQDTFRRFRDRFGPTNALPTLLFPMTDLSEVPTQVAYDPAGGWLEDPTKAVRTGAQFKAISAEWITHKAMLMLCKLIHWRDPDYYRKGQGGFVDNWRNAATTWHIARLESELASGATVGMELVAPHHRKGLQRLKAKLGVALLTSPTRRPQRGIDTSHEAYVEFESLERASRDAERKQAEAIKHFNKIVRATCTKCPETAMLFFPMGFEGLVEHMRIAHPRSFWEGKFHCLG